MTRELGVRIYQIRSISNSEIENCPRELVEGYGKIMSKLGLRSRHENHWDFNSMRPLDEDLGFYVHVAGEMYDENRANDPTLIGQHDGDVVYYLFTIRNSDGEKKFIDQGTGKVDRDILYAKGKYNWKFKGLEMIKSEWY